jgi:hypothetical protein
LSTDYSVRSGGPPIPRDSAQNWWRQQAAEFGLLGAIIAIWWTALVLVLIFRRRRPGASAVVASGARGAVLALGITSTFGGYYLTPAVLLAAWPILFWAACVLRGRVDLQLIGPTGTKALATGWAVALMFTLGQYAQARGDLGPPLRAMKVGLAYAYGFERGGVTSDGEPFWWTDRHAVMVFPVNREVLTLAAIALHPDVAITPVRVRLLVRGTTVIDRRVDDHAPIVVRLVPRRGETALMVETVVSRLFTDNHGASRGLMLTKRVEASGAAPNDP